MFRYIGEILPFSAMLLFLQRFDYSLLVSYNVHNRQQNQLAARCNARNSFNCRIVYGFLQCIYQWALLEQLANGLCERKSLFLSFHLTASLPRPPLARLNFVINIIRMDGAVQRHQLPSANSYFSYFNMHKNSETEISDVVFVALRDFAHCIVMLNLSVEYSTDTHHTAELIIRLKRNHRPNWEMELFFYRLFMHVCTVQCLLYLSEATQCSVPTADAVRNLWAMR